MLGNQVESPVADWPTKRAWVDYAFDQFGAAGYATSSAYTLVKDKSKVNFSYRDNLWHGADMLATGVASFGHASGVHYQNEPDWAGYVGRLEKGELPLARGMAPTAHQLLVRETILQLKTGHLDVAYFRDKFGVDIIDHWRSEWQQHADDGYLEFDQRQVTLTRAGLLRADALLPAFFEPEHRDVRYT
jgi:oxygen-independent coproporphyrinogen-3 oxidase